MAFLNLKNILLTKISNVQKMKYHMISFILNSGKGKAIGAEKRHNGYLGQRLNTKSCKNFFEVIQVF